MVPGCIIVRNFEFNFLFHGRVHVICHMHDQIHLKTTLGQALTSLETSSSVLVYDQTHFIAIAVLKDLLVRLQGLFRAVS